MVPRGLLQQVFQKRLDQSKSPRVRFQRLEKCLQQVLETVGIRGPIFDCISPGTVMKVRL